MRRGLHILAWASGSIRGAPCKTRYSTQEVAALAGVHKDTLLRWLRKGWVKEPARDFRG